MPGVYVLYETTYPIQPAAATTFGISGVWFNWYQEEAKRQGRSVPTEMHEVPRTERRWAKERVAEAARKEWREMVLHIREEISAGTRGRRKVAYTPEGQRVGTINRDSEGRVMAGEMLRAGLAIAQDGAVRVVVQERKRGARA